jgi:sulfur-oxidizing protein SoxY
MNRAKDIRAKEGTGRIGGNARGAKASAVKARAGIDGARLCDRRFFVTAAGALGGALMLPLPATCEEPQSWELAVKKVLGDAKPADGKAMLDMPEIAENGNTVPFTVSLDSPMTDKEYVKAFHIIATANPQPAVAAFRLTPQSGKATVSSRIRLARTQEVIAIAELSDGTFLMSKRNVKVTIGGCGG